MPVFTGGKKKKDDLSSPGICKKKLLNAALSHTKIYY